MLSIAEASLYDLKRQTNTLKNDDLDIACSSQLNAIIFLQTMFTCCHTSLQMETHS